MTKSKQSNGVVVAATNALTTEDPAVVYYPPGHTLCACSKCRTPIGKTQAFRRINSRMYHSACVRCCKCAKELKDNFVWCNNGKEMLCHACRQSHVIVCLKCRLAISGKGADENTDGDGHYWHKDHYKCELCSETLRKATATVVLSKAFHRNCVRCQDCVEKLAHKTYNVVENKVTCEACFPKRFYPECGKCRQRITCTGYSVNNAFWHVECLKCAACEKNITTDKVDDCVGTDKHLFCSIKCAERLCEKCENICGVESKCPCTIVPKTDKTEMSPESHTRKHSSAAGALALEPKKLKGGRASRSKSRERQRSKQTADREPAKQSRTRHSTGDTGKKALPAGRRSVRHNKR